MPFLNGWGYLLVSSALQVGWIESLNRTAGFRHIGAVAWYAAFGISSTLTLSKALESLPLSTAYAVWTALSVAGSVGIDQLSGRAAPTPARFACLVAILAGTAGLRFLTPGK